MLSFLDLRAEFKPVLNLWHGIRSAGRETVAETSHAFSLSSVQQVIASVLLAVAGPSLHHAFSGSWQECD
jgi:hypothetical protein